MKKEINLSEFVDEFKAYNRNYYSYEGYEALYEYYSEFENFDFDVIAICCDVSEYDEEELLNDYSYLVQNEEEQGLIAIIEELQQRTNITELSNGSYLVWGF